jgi:catechol 2,3-dioxygenase-like lactoylglutathione lyase family enzyme
VSDPERSAEFYAWLLDLAPEADGAGFRLPCANGELIIDADSSTPVALGLQAGDERFDGSDPDGTLIAFSNHRAEAGSASVKLDHVSLNCANLAATIAFYRELGFVITWSGVPPDYETSLTGFQEEPLPGADWVHVSSSDGYLALMQADWQDYGRHNANSGPPRFVHIGFAVTNLDIIAARLADAGIPNLRAPRDSIGDRLYLNDPDGDTLLGHNIELVQYQRGARRSGQPPY